MMRRRSLRECLPFIVSRRFNFLEELKSKLFARRLNAEENFVEESSRWRGWREASTELALTPLQCLFMTRFKNFVKDARALLCVGCDGFYGRRVNISINFLRFYVDCFLINSSEFTVVAERLHELNSSARTNRTEIIRWDFPPKPIKARSNKICRPSLESF